MAMRTPFVFFSAAKRHLQRDKTAKTDAADSLLSRPWGATVGFRSTTRETLWRKKKTMLFSYSRNTDNVTLSALWNYQMTHVNLVTAACKI